MSDEDNPLLKWQTQLDRCDKNDGQDCAYFKREFGMGFEYPEEPLDQETHEEFEELRTRYESGNHFAIIHALSICAFCGLRMPEWVAYGFWLGYQKLRKFEARTLDEVFGSNLPKGKSLAAFNKNRTLSLKIYLHVRKLRREGKPVDEALVDAGEKYAVSGSSASDYYYAWKHRMEIQAPDE
jgi:hypothetical protein